MNKKGFTLVEILGVIILISLLSVLILPKIVDSVKNSSDKIDDSTKNMIYKALNLYISDNESKYVKNTDNTYCITLRELVDSDYLKSPINVSNKDITDLKSVQVTYNKNFKYKIVNNNACTNVVDNYICKPVTKATTGSIPRGNYNYGDEYTCDVGDGELKTFFLLEKSGNNISLIMSSNVSSSGKIETAESLNKSTTAWVTKEDYMAAGGTEADYGSYGNNNKGPITANQKLHRYTSSWSKIKQSQIKLPVYNQVYKAAGNTSSNIPTWLYGNLSKPIISGTETRLDGYFTSTLYANTTYQAWVVSYVGLISYINVNYSTSYGIRPVIILTQDQVKEPERTCSIVSGTGNVGDVVECNGDNFYVLENSSGMLKLITTDNITTASNIVNAIDLATNYGNSLKNNNYNIISSRLLYYYEIESMLKNKTQQINSHEYETLPITIDNAQNIIDTTWLYQNSSNSSISYWILYSEDDNGRMFDSIYIDGTLPAVKRGSGTFGVRPVITIPSSILK